MPFVDLKYAEESEDKLVVYVVSTADSGEMLILFLSEFKKQCNPELQTDKEINVIKYEITMSYLFK